MRSLVVFAGLGGAVVGSVGLGEGVSVGSGVRGFVGGCCS